MTHKDIVLLIKVRQLAKSGKARRVRQSSGLSLTEVADAIGVSVGTVSRWENGQRRPTGRRAVAYGQLIDRLQREVKSA